MAKGPGRTRKASFAVCFFAVSSLFLGASKGARWLGRGVMPRGRRAKEAHSIWKDDSTGEEYVLERYAKPHVHSSNSNIQKDTRVAHFAPDTRKMSFVKPSFHPQPSRVDLRIRIPPLAARKQILYHRLVAYVLHGGTYEAEGGVQVQLPAAWSWKDFEASGLVVDHGGRGTRFILAGLLKICTKKRNYELEKEREKNPRFKREVAVLYSDSDSE